MANSKRTLFLKRRLRVRNKLRKVNAGRVRLSVHRSNKNISVQLIDDVRGVTLASASTLEKALGVVGKNNVEAAAKVGAAIAERAKKAGVEDCYFDRGGFLFHGKVKALADAAREGGLKFYAGSLRGASMIRENGHDEDKRSAATRRLARKPRRVAIAMNTGIRRSSGGNQPCVENRERW